MQSEAILFSVFLIFTGAAVLSTFALFTRQSLLVAYMILGVALGPWGLKLVADATTIKHISDIGIIFLLFLLGLHLQPQNLYHMLRKVTWVALISSTIFAGLGYGVGFYFGFTSVECMVIGASVMFSSTIIGLKLLPTTILHHQHTGEVMISVLLMQDIIAIAVLLILNSAISSSGFDVKDLVLFLVAVPAIILLAYLMQRFVLMKLLERFDTIQEYIFLLSIGWCLGLAQLAGTIGLSEDIGAFIAGVALAANPIALYIAESLKPLRDFFLVMFFFSIGASFKMPLLESLWIPATVLATLILLVKPLVFKLLLRASGESNSVSWEVGARLGQASEFSLLVVYLASGALISETASYMVQATTILTFVASSYLVVWRYPTPLSLSEKLHRD